MSTNPEHKLRFSDVLNIAAPHTWSASVMPAVLSVSIGFKMKGFIRPDLAICLFVAVILMQSAVNTLNDYADYIKGTDTSDNSPDATDAVIVYGLNPKVARNLGVIFLLSALLPGAYIIWKCGIIPLIIGLIGAAVVVTYSLGKLPVSYLPIGELVSGFVMGGLITVAGVYTFTGVADGIILLKSVPMILGIALIMFSNNGCDIERDTLAGRKTAACLLGRKRTDSLYRILLVVYLIIPMIIFIILGAYISALIYILQIPMFLHVFIRQMKLQLGQEQRGLVMAGINTLNVMLGFAYCVSLMVM